MENVEKNGPLRDSELMRKRGRKIRIFRARSFAPAPPRRKRSRTTNYTQSTRRIRIFFFRIIGGWFFFFFFFFYRFHPFVCFANTGRAKFRTTSINVLFYFSPFNRHNILRRCPKSRIFRYFV